MAESLQNKKILITSGPTWVPIDDVRVISNISTGELGQTLARKSQGLGADVTMLEGPVEKRLALEGVTIKPFKYYSELMTLLRDELSRNDVRYDAIFHAAAVSDYTIQNPSTTKMKSDEPTIQLDLIPLPKLIRSIRKLAPKSLIIGFKLESDMNEELAVSSTTKLFSDAYCDLVLANTLKEQNYLGYVVENQTILASAESRAAVADALLDVVSRKLNAQDK